MESTFSEAVEDEFHAFEAEYSINQDTFVMPDTEQATSNSESEEEEMTELPCCEFQPNTMNRSLQVEDNEETKQERALISKFVCNTCNCSLGPKKSPCSAYFTTEEVTDQREHCLTLEKSELDLVVLSQLQALGKDVADDSQRSKYIEFTSRGNVFVEKLFCFCIQLVRSTIVTF